MLVVSGTLLISTGTHDIAVYTVYLVPALVTARATHMYSETMTSVLVTHVVNENPVFYRNHPHCMVAKKSTFKTVVRFQQTPTAGTPNALFTGKFGSFPAIYKLISLYRGICHSISLL